MTHPFSKLALLGLIAGVLLPVQAGAQAAEPPPVTGSRVATLEDKRINESSGLALSARDPKFFWTHNDSGGEPCVFAISRQGRTLAKVRVRNAVNFDWEDIASGTDADGRPVLFVGDIGDNLHARPTVQVYQIPEPPLPKDPKHEVESEPALIYHAAYPKGRLNAESLLYHPITRRLYILSKDEAGRSALYLFPEKLDTQRMMILEKVVDVFFPPVPRKGKRLQDASETTAACFSPNGTRLAVATYSYIYEWQIGPKETLAEALQKPGRMITPPPSAQMEALCYDADGRTLWFTTERLPTGLFRIPQEN